MPAQVAVQRAVTRIGREPRRQEGAGRVRITLLVAECARACAAQGFFGFCARERSIFGLAASSLSVLRQRHPVMRREPPIIAVARRKLVQQFQQHALLPGAAGAADQAVGECGGGEHHGIARPGIQDARATRKVPPRHRLPQASRKTRHGWLPVRTNRRRGTWPPRSTRVPPPRPRAPAARAPWRHGRGQSRDRRRWRDRTPRSRRDTWSASPRSPRHRRPARRTRWWTREAVSVRQHVVLVAKFTSRAGRGGAGSARRSASCPCRLP